MDLFAKIISIPSYGCTLNFLVLYTFVDSECLLLALMAYDRYKAVSNPLLYAVSMSSRVYSLLMAGVYLAGMIDALINTTLAFHLCFCGSNEINHIFCNVPPLLLISCSDTQVIELVIFMVFGFIELNFIFRSPCLLFLYHLISLEDLLCWREVQSFLHLYIPPNCCGNFPGNSALYVFHAEFFILSRWRQNDLIVLHPCDSHVKPSDLQPKEWRCETGPGKIEK